MRSRAIRVLLVEDDQADMLLLKNALRAAEIRHELHHVTNLSEATDTLANRDFDLVVSDLSLPDSNGRQTIERIKAVAAEVPIVVLSGLDDGELAVALLDSGAQDYIPKDRLTGDVLDRAIRHSILRQQQLVETRRLLREVEDGRDLLEAKNNKLEKLYKQAHEFVDNISHEFRTPLTVIKEYISLVGDGLAGEVNDEQIRMLNVVEDRADDLNTMVNDMVDSSKLEAGVIGAWRKPCTVADIMNHVTPTLSRKAQIKRVKLEYEIAAGLPQLYCDAEKVGRVITNLAVNAIKFSGDPGIVRITVNRTNDHSDVLFSVIDNGPGIDQESLQKIFGRFQQLGTTSRGSCKGFGLGLAIAKELVDLNFGTMSIDSQFGRGSTFGFSIPTNDPLRVIERYLQHIEHQAECPPIVSLVSARVDSTAKDDDDSGIDCFLNYLLRRNDLLLPCRPGEWLLVLPTDRQEVQRYFERSYQAWEENNRNRPIGALPRISYQLLGSWRIPSDDNRILEMAAQQVAGQEVTCA